MKQIQDWLVEVGGEEYALYIKRLSGNDTLANGSHQAGPYIPKNIFFELFPQLAKSNAENPDQWVELIVDSHQDDRKVRVIWYNNKIRGGTRDEARITNFGGADSAILNPESTGAIAVFAFRNGGDRQTTEIRAWVSRGIAEEECLEQYFGAIEPGSWKFESQRTRVDHSIAAKKRPCWLSRADIPDTWLKKFPSGLELIEKVIDLDLFTDLDVDDRIVKRRLCEYDLFRSLESIVELPTIQCGFDSVDAFVEKAHSILQRRKSRSGRSLELHAKVIFDESGLVEGKDYSYQPITELGKKPDFIFPSIDAYKDEATHNNLRMLAVKTTCKDRWRQILSEADRIKCKHLLTFQEGVSLNQFAEMKHEGVKLVVPKPLFSKYHSDIVPELTSLEAFIAETQLMSDLN